MSGESGSTGSKSITDLKKEQGSVLEVFVFVNVTLSIFWPVDVLLCYCHQTRAKLGPKGGGRESQCIHHS